MAYIPYPPKSVLVDSLDDLPAPVGNVITLQADTTYTIITNLILGANKLVCQNNVAIIGDSLVNSSITSNLLAGEDVITSPGQIQISTLNFIGLGQGRLFNLNGITNPSGGCYVREIRAFTIALGTIKNYNALRMDTCVFENNKGGLTIDGSNQKVTLDYLQFLNTVAGVTALTFPATYSCVDKTRLLTSVFNSVAGNTSLNVNPGVGVSPESFLLTEANFTGAGTKITGIDSANTKALFTRNSGVRNTYNMAYYFSLGNVTPTVFANTTNFVKVAGISAMQAVSQRFDNAGIDNRAVYVGSITRTFKIATMANLFATTNNITMMMRIAKNGVTIADSEAKVTTGTAGFYENITCVTLQDLNTNDYIEVFLRNSTNTSNITVTDLSVVVEATDQ